MKKLIKSIVITTLAIIMVVSSFVIVAADVITPVEDKIEITASSNGGIYSPLAYELIWKYKAGNGHVWKRRWNMTLGIWYDPEWILVY